MAGESAATATSGPRPASAGNAAARPRVLLVAYEFPPRGGAGVQRPAKTVRAWLERQLPVAVLRGPVDPRFVDPALADGIPDEIATLARDPGPLKALQNLRRRLRPRGLADRALIAASAAVQVFCIPDAHNAWLLTAVPRGSRLARSFRPDVVVATGPPFSSFLTAGLIARLSGIPLVLDYRDPWTANYLARRPAALAGRINPHLERWALGQADGVIAAHRAVFDYLRRAGLLPDGVRRMWVPNGFDPADFPGPPPGRADRFTLTYTGHFYGFRDPKVLLEVLEELLASGAIDPERFRFRLAGERNAVQAIMKPGPTLSRVLQMEGYLSHPDSVRCLRESTVNLVLEGTSGGRNRHSPGKVFEVLYAGRPVLLICPDGTTPRLARRAGGCRILDPADRQGIRESLLELYRAWSDHRMPDGPDPERIRFYDRGLQAERMTALLRRVVADAGRRGLPGAPR